MRKIILLVALLALCGVPLLAQNQQVTGTLTASDSGACSTANACLVLKLNSNSGATIVQLAGTFSATVQFEGTADGANWVAVNGNPVGGTVAVQSATTAGGWQVNVAGMVAVRIRASTYASGTVQAVITSSVASAANHGGGGGGSGTVNSGLAHQPAFYPANGAAVSGTCTVPATNGQFPMLFNVTADAAVDPSCPQSGFINTAITGAATSYTISAANNLQGLEHDVAATQSVTYSLPTPTTLENTQFAIPQICNYSTHTDTLTPVTWTINGAANVTIISNQCRSLSIDPFNANNWLSPVTSTGNLGAPLASYSLSISSGTIVAAPNRPGLATYTGTDLTPVIANVMTALTPTCGRIYMQLGVYPVNTFATESTGGFSNSYVLGIPPAASSGQYCKWVIEGEATTPAINLFGTTAQTAGVILNVTSTALATVTATTKVIGIWGRPDVTNGIGPVVSIDGIDVRFPDNQRGCETGVDLTQTLDTDVENSMVDTAVIESSLDFPLAASCTSWGGTDRGGLEGFLTTNSQKEENFLRHDYTFGAYEGFDLRSEHVIMENSFALDGDYGIEYGVQTGPHNIDWASQFRNVGCGRMARCLTLGSHLNTNTLLDISGLTFEDPGSPGAFAPVYHAIETNVGFSYGRISWQQVLDGAPAIATVFDGGGGTSFDQRNRAQSVYNPGTLQDIFNQSAPGYWWAKPGWSGNAGLKISGGSVLVNSTGNTSGQLLFVASSFNTDQYSKATVSAMDTGASSFDSLYVNAQNSSTRNYYQYYCSGIAAVGSGIVKQVAGSQTNLSVQTSAAGCAATDIIELRNSNGLICAYRNGVLDANLNPPCVTDTSLTGGFPGVGVEQTTTGGVSESNFFGGSLTNLHGPDSIYGQPGAWQGQQSFNAGLLTKLYTVSSGTTYPALPSASSVAKGTALWVTDSTSIAPGTCVGGSTHWVMAISDGSAWNCP